ncbi:hypothetical protein BJX76DRAFT_348040 [Aspergillus varians]
MGGPRPMKVDPALHHTGVTGWYWSNGLIEGSRHPIHKKAYISNISDETLINLFKIAPILYTCSDTHVVRFSSSLILKGGAFTQPSEAAMLELIRTTTPTPLPKVHCVLDTDSKSSAYGPQCLMLMVFIEDRSVKEIWSEASDTQREDIVSQVASMIKSMESVTVPQDPGPLNCQQYRCGGSCFTDYGAGPFSNAPESIPPFRFRKLVLTHGDIAPRDLIVGTDGNVWLVDWEMPGIFPLGMDAATLRLDQFRAPLFTDLLLAKIERHEVLTRQLQSIMYGLTTGIFLTGDLTLG